MPLVENLMRLMAGARLSVRGGWVPEPPGPTGDRSRRRCRNGPSITSRTAAT
jgi:hypothetical protein